jgi:hypothetical protein
MMYSRYRQPLNGSPVLVLQLDNGVKQARIDLLRGTLQSSSRTLVQKSISPQSSATLPNLLSFSAQAWPKSNLTRMAVHNLFRASKLFRRIARQCGLHIVWLRRETNVGLTDWCEFECPAKHCSSGVCSRCARLLLLAPATSSTP